MLLALAGLGLSEWKGAKKRPFSPVDFWKKPLQCSGFFLTVSLEPVLRSACWRASPDTELPKPERRPYPPPTTPWKKPDPAANWAETTAPVPSESQRVHRLQSPSFLTAPSAVHGAFRALWGHRETAPHIFFQRYPLTSTNIGPSGICRKKSNRDDPSCTSRRS